MTNVCSDGCWRYSLGITSLSVYMALNLIWTVHNIIYYYCTCMYALLRFSYSISVSRYDMIFKSLAFFCIGFEKYLYFMVSFPCFLYSLTLIIFFHFVWFVKFVILLSIGVCKNITTKLTYTLTVSTVYTASSYTSKRSCSVNRLKQRIGNKKVK